MPEIEEWTKDKSFPIAFLAPFGPAVGKETYEGLKNIKQRKIHTHQFRLPDLPTWFDLYRSEWKALKVVERFDYKFSDMGKTIAPLGVGLRIALKSVMSLQDRLNKLAEGSVSPEEKEILEKELKEFFNTMKLTPEQQFDVESFQKCVLSKTYSYLTTDEATLPDPQTDAMAQKYFEDHQLEFGFFFLVLYPCWIIYQDWPSKLYQEALNGKVRSMEKLLKLDPLLLHDHAIGSQIQALRMNNRTNDYERVLDAAKKSLKISRKKIKLFNASITSSVAKSINEPLTNPKNRNLYDAYAKDTEGKLIDTDLPVSPEAFDKALQRLHTGLKNLYRLPDKII